jgi:hypothetical protein
MTNDIALRLAKANAALALKIGELANESGQAALANTQEAVAHDTAILSEGTKTLTNGGDWASITVALTNIPLSVLKIHNAHVQHMTDLGMKITGKNFMSLQHAITDWQSEVQSALQTVGADMPSVNLFGQWPSNAATQGLPSTAVTKEKSATA